MRILPGYLALLCAAGALLTLSASATAVPIPTQIPSITGDRRVTQELRVSTGRWRGDVTSHRYRWMTTTQRGAFRTSRPIAGATGDRLQVGAAQAGLRIGACVQARAGTGPWSRWSCAYATRIVPPGNVARPTARGTIRANAEITGSPGRWHAATRGISYAWQTSADGQTWVFAVGPQRARAIYRVAPSEVGIALRLRAIGRNGGGNSLPAISNVIAPNPPTPGAQGQYLIRASGGRYLAADGAWEGGRVQETRYVWQVASAPDGPWRDAPGATNAAEYAPPRPDIDRYLRVTVIKTNGGGSTALASAPIDLPQPPAVISPPLIRGEAREGSTLTMEAARFAGDVSTTRHSWLRCNADGESCASVGDGGLQYIPGAADVGLRIRARSVAENPIGSATATSDATSIVVPLPPSSRAPPTIGGTPQVAVALSSAAEWDGIISTTAWQWQRCPDSACSTATDISGATEPSYVPTRADEGLHLRLRATASNAGGSNTATSAVTAAVLPPPPSTLAAPSISGATLEDDTLTAADGAWLDMTSTARVWLRCDSAGAACASTGQTGSTYTLGAADVGATLRIQVTANGPGGSTAATSAATGVVLPLPPVNTALPAVSGTAQVGQTLAVTNGSWSSAGAITGYTYQWQRDGGSGWSTIPGATASTYTLTASDYNATVRGGVIAGNAGGAGVVAWSAATESVLPAAPVNTAAPTVCAAPKVDVSCAGTDGTFTGQGTITYTYQWSYSATSGGTYTDVTGATGQNFTPTPTQYDGYLKLTVTATNAGGSATSTSSPTAASVLPAAPVNTAIPTVCAAPKVGTPCAGTDGTFTGQGSIAYTYQWQFDDPSDMPDQGWQDIAGATSQSFSPTATQYDGPLRLAVTATNAGGSTSATSAATAAVLPDAPVVAAASAVTCGAPQVDVACAADAATFSGQGAITRTYQWQFDDPDDMPDQGWQNIPGANGSIAGAAGDGASVSFTPTASEYDAPLRLVTSATNAGGVTSSTSAASAATLPAAPAPGPGAADITCAPPRVDESCSGSAGGWGTQGPTSYTYTWEINDGSGWSTVQTMTTSATSDSYTPSSIQAGQQLRLSVAASNPGGTATTTGSSLTVAPYNAGGGDLPTVCATPTAGQACTGTAGSWLGTPDSYAYQWQRSSGGAWADISGATALTYTPVAGDAGYTLRLSVTATKGGSASAAAVSAASGTTVGYPVVTGGTLTSDATYYYRTFTTDGTLTVSEASLTADVLVVGGGGGGGGAGTWYGDGAKGGGGAGGRAVVSSHSIAIGSHAALVGDGGAGGSTSVHGDNGGNGSSGETSSLGTMSTAAGGGGGGGGAYVSGLCGGSGGSNGLYTGSSGVCGSGSSGDGGTGAGAGGNAGTASVVWGTSYAAGGSGGGGACTTTDGAANRGQGGSGSGAITQTCTSNSGNGGSGIVVVRYPRSAVGG